MNRVKKQPQELSLLELLQEVLKRFLHSGIPAFRHLSRFLFSSDDDMRTSYTFYGILYLAIDGIASKKAPRAGLSKPNNRIPTLFISHGLCYD